MSIHLKYRLAQLGCWVGLPLAAYCFSKVYQYGLGNTSRAELWFAALLIVVLAASGSGIAFYYFRSKVGQSDTDAIALKTLAELGRQRQTRNHAEPSSKE